MPTRLRQAVVAAEQLDPVTAELSGALGLGPPYHDPAVAAFGLRNAVFALDDAFLEVVSPFRDDTAAGRWLARRGGDCGYMAMFEVEDLAAARGRAAELGVREVFGIELDDIVEVHLHPADVGGAIVALSQPHPPGAWRWGGPGWRERSRPLGLTGLTLSVSDPRRVQERWSTLLGVPAATLGIRFTDEHGDAGIVEIALSGPAECRLDLGGVQVSCAP